MDEMTDDENRIRALGQLRSHPGAEDAARELAVALEDPEVRAEAERSRGRLRRSSIGKWVATGSLIAVVGVGVAVPAAALSSFLARTGEFGDPTTSTEVDESEWIALGADDAPQVVIDAYPDYLTLPPGVPRDAAIADVSKIFARLDAEAGGQGLAQEGLMASTYDGFAICAWTVEWLTAEKASDADREQLAADWLSDTDNFRTLVASDGGGVTEWLMEIASAARAGDVNALRDFNRQLDCVERLDGVKR